MSDLSIFLRATYQGRTQPDQDNPTQLTAKIDDENSTDRGLCQIHVRTTGPSTFELKLTGSPMSSDVREFIASHGGEIAESINEIKLPLSVKQIAVIRKLARVIRSTVGRGRRYLDPNWKWICPRTADSLGRLADELAAYRGLVRGDADLQSK